MYAKCLHIAGFPFYSCWKKAEKGEKEFLLCFCIYCIPAALRLEKEEWMNESLIIVSVFIHTALLIVVLFEAEEG